MMKPLLTLWLSLTLLPAQDQVDLRLDWQTGKSYLQQITLDQVIGVPRHGEATAHTELQMKLTAREAKGGAKSLQANFSAMKIAVDLPLPATDERFDSHQPKEGNQEIATFYQSLKAAPLKMALDARGKIKEVQGLEKLNSGNAVLNRFFGQEQIKNFLQQGGLVELPTGAVSRGDHWPYQMAFPTPVGKLLIKGQYTLAGTREYEDKPHLVIQMQGQVQGDFTTAAAQETDPEVLRIQGMMLLMGVKVKEGSTSGTLLYDSVRRLLVSSEVTTTIRLSVAKYPENGQPTEIPIQQKMSLQLRPAP